MIVYLFLVIFIGTFIVLGFGMLFYRWKTLTEETPADEGLLSRDLALFTAAIVLSASAIIVLVGTSAPLFGQSVDAFFYNEMHVPLVIIIGLLNGISLLLKWKTTKKEDFIKKSIFSVAAAIIFTILIIVFGKVSKTMIIILAFSTSFTFFVNLEIAIKIVRGNMKMLGAYVAHIGIALFILGVIGSAAYSKEQNIDLVKGEPKEAFGYQMTFTGYHPIENNTKYAFNVDIKKGDKIYSVSPIMYISDFNNGLMREPAILTMFSKDIYVSPLGYEDQSQSGVQGETINLTLGGSKEIDGVRIDYKDFDRPDMSVMQSGGDFQMGAKLVITKDGKSYNAEPLIKKEGRDFKYVPDLVEEANIKIEVKKINPQTQEAEFIISKINSDNISSMEPKEVLSITASVKPFISLVWVGVLIMVIGFFVSVARRLPESFVK